MQAKTHKWHFKLEARFQTIMKSTQISSFKGIQIYESYLRQILFAWP
jgi:hypothetical protein